MKNRKKDDKIFSLYSGHDTTIMPLLVALKSYDNVWPTFCSYISIEYYDETNMVKILYNDKYIIEMNINEFYDKLLKDLIINDQDEWKNVCEQEI